MAFCNLSPAPHLLLVDDEPESIEPLRIRLERNGARTSCASEPALADEILAREPIDVVLCDIHMPGNSRLEWVRRCTANPAFPPLLLLTGHPEIDTTILAANLPVAGYLVKPPDFDELCSQLIRCIARKRLRDDLVAHVRSLEAGSSPAETDRKYAAQLHQMAEQLSDPRICSSISGPPVDWPSIVKETIDVLIATKGKFHSKELFALRKKLTSLLPPSTPQAAPGKTSDKSGIRD